MQSHRYLEHAQEVFGISKQISLPGATHLLPHLHLHLVLLIHCLLETQRHLSGQQPDTVFCTILVWTALDLSLTLVILASRLQT